MSDKLKFKGAMMGTKSKIALLSALLLLFLIICSWYKASTMNLKPEIAKETNQTQQKVASKAKQEPITFSVKKSKEGVDINGKFYDDAQMRSFGENFSRSGTIHYLCDDFDQNRKPNEALVLAKDLSPIFNNYFIEGSIVYEGDEVIVEGVLKDDQAKATLVALLKEHKIPYVDKTTILQTKDSFMNLAKSKDGSYRLDANLSSESEKSALLNMCEGFNPTNNIVVDQGYAKSAWQETVSKLIPIVRDKFVEGRVYYIDGKIGVEGVTNSPEARDEIQKILKESKIPYSMNIVIQKPKTEEVAKKEPSKEENNQTETSTIKVPDATDYDAIYKSMTPEERALSKKIEDNISALLKVENITFKTGSAKLTPKSKEIVKRIANVLTQYPNVYIEIAGHTDDVGDDQANLKLSQRRVESVKAELVRLGIDPKRLKAVGYGETRPKVPNDTPEHRRQNRRVEFHIIKIVEEGQ